MTGFYPGTGARANPPRPGKYEEALKLTEGAADVHRVLAQNAPSAPPGRPKNDRQNNTGVRPYFSRTKSKTKAVLAVRLAQEHGKVYEAYLRGEYRSIRAAAEAAGLASPANEPLQRLKSNWRKATGKDRREFLKWMESEDANGDGK